MRVVDDDGDDNDCGDDDDNNNSAVKGAWFPNCCLGMSPTLVTQTLFKDSAFSEQEERTHKHIVHISYVLAT